MPLEPGTRLGPYEVLAPIGAGPEERYKASDTRRNRIVALKVLPPEFSDPQVKQRLERDARTISSLKHPNICAPLDVGHEDPATEFVVTDYIEGETLAQRLARGSIELQESLNIAIAIADSLDKAHRQGIRHGGLNPSTVMLTPAGLKLLDFGVTTLKDDLAFVGPTSMATTRTSIATLSAVPGFATPYLAPEQLVGEVDARSDIFAFGAILYEMVTGRPAFQEKTQALLIAAIQSVDPEPASKLQRATSPALDYVIKRCLTKDPRQRIQSALDVLSELQWIARGDLRTVSGAARVTGATRERILWASLAVVSIVAIVLAPSTLATFRGAAAPAQVRFLAAALPPGTTPVSISPDGRWLLAGINGGPMTALALDAVTPQTLIRGIPAQPFWSPDSRSIAYFEDGKLKRADIGGGPPQIICDTPPLISAGTWNSDGVILFPGAGVVQRVLAAGGQPAPITSLDESRHETEHLGPWFLPDGRRFLYLAVSSQPNESAIYVGTLDSKDRVRLFASETKAVYAAPGYLLFNRGDTVFAQTFDAGGLTLKGEPIRVASGVPLRVPAPNGSPGVTRSANFAVSQSGVLVYRTGASAATPTPGNDEQRSLVWFDRNGQAGPPLGATGTYAGIDLSPDGKRLAVHRHEGAGGDDWVINLAEGRMQRLTFDASQENSSPIWSPDGTQIAFAAQRNNKSGLYVKLADGTAREELIVESETQKVPMSWSPDGKLLIYSQNSGVSDVLAIPVTGDKKPVPLLQSQFAETFPQVSPDGKWMAYASNETGRFEIYVKPFPEGPAKWQVSTDGGGFPRWRRDGKELFFYANNSLIAADIRVTGSSLEAGVPHALFGLANPGAAVPHAPYHRFAVTADGQRFLIAQPGTAGPTLTGGLADTIARLADQGSGTAAAATPNAVMVVLNWTQTLAQK